ncbi:hypothetical protein [Neobacillus drentensis]|uniref:hypothetical protein n=1 Tax=Neobacillus drentensis TaxID=220684 RepID=UPI0028564B0A|nr:hypothetical protein [Neobacillus drentensis]MDR7239154.1 hypothetical protein [Neobacillus drentensis]
MEIIVMVGIVLILSVLIPFFTGGTKGTAQEIRNSVAIKLGKKLLFLSILIGGSLYLGITLSEAFDGGGDQASEMINCNQEADYYWDDSLGMCVPDSEKPISTHSNSSYNSQPEKPVLRADSHIEYEQNKNLSQEEYNKKLAEQQAADQAAAEEEAQQREADTEIEEKESACLGMRYSWYPPETDRPEGLCVEEGLGSYWRPVKLEKNESGRWVEVEEKE